MTLTDLFDRMPALRVGVIGDFALDTYYDLRTQTGEFSLETGREVHWGRRPRTAPGGAGNVVQNLAALGVGTMQVFGGVGDDLFGRELRYRFQQAGVDTAYLQTWPDGWDTCTYTKPMLDARTEAHRLDFGTHNHLAEEAFAAVLADLARALPALDVLIINQQFPNPLLTEARMQQLNALVAEHPGTHCMADLRQVGLAVRGMTLKVNTAELARLLDLELPPAPDADWCRTHALQLSVLTGGPVLLTRSEAGILYLGPEGVEAVAGLPLTGELDPVGAGDTVVAAFAAARAAGASPAQAIDLANRAAAVTVRKIGQTGTATPTEILALSETL